MGRYLDDKLGNESKITREKDIVDLCVLINYNHEAIYWFKKWKCNVFVQTCIAQINAKL